MKFSQSDIISTILNQKINGIVLGESQWDPFQTQNEIETYNKLTIVAHDKRKKQLNEYELSPTFPIYNNHDNRCKLIIKRQSQPLEHYSVKKINRFSNVLPIDFNVDRICLFEESASADYLEELKDYPTLTSTVSLEDLAASKFLIVKSHKDEYETYSRKIIIRFGHGNMGKEFSRKDAHLVSKFER